MKITLNERNLMLEGPTHRCQNLTSSLQRPTPLPPSTPSFSFSPSEPAFGLLSANCEYELKVKIMNMGADNQRIRCVPPSPNSTTSSTGCLTDATATQQNAEVTMEVSSTKLFPGLFGTLTLRVSCHQPGPFSYDFAVVGEVERYTITVVGHVLPEASFDALSLLRKLEGKPALEDGVVLVKDNTAEAVCPESTVFEDEPPTSAAIGGAEGTSGEAPTPTPQPREALDTLYDPDLLDDVRFFPTLPGLYFDKTLNAMSLDVKSFHNYTIDPALSLQEVVSLSLPAELSAQDTLEKSGHLSRRCIEQLREDSKVPKPLFRTLRKSMAAHAHNER
jgi:hypothetical protein